MKIGLISAYLLTIATVASAQTPGVEPSKQAPRTKAQPAKVAPQKSPKPTPHPATGPTGMGSIRIGMSKDAVMALPADEPVRLIGEMTPTVEKTEQPPGTERFEGLITVPFSVEPVKATFSFKNGILHGLSLSREGDDALLERLVNQISERYGAGKVDDKRKEEQCIYRNGNNFTLKSGMLSTMWSTPNVDGKLVTTYFTDIVFNSCPSNLRDGSTYGVKMKMLSIRLNEKESVAPKKSLF